MEGCNLYFGAVGGGTVLTFIPEKIPSNEYVLFVLWDSSVFFFVIFLFQSNILKRFICIERGNAPALAGNKQTLKTRKMLPL